jgi:hypothetical protein
MQDCSLWSQVAERLNNKFPDYTASEFERRVREIQYFKNFDRIPALIKTKEWLPFIEVVKVFYTSISEISQRTRIIDSSKSMAWAYLLQHLDGFDVRVIHLERNLSEVANSWKKTIRLPEYTDREVFMPRKGNMLVTKTWLKIKFMGRILKRQPHYGFVNYRNLCKNPEVEVKKIMTLVDEDIPMDNLQVLPNHAIGGNPMRRSLKKLEIKNVISNNEHLNFFERLFFNAISGLAKVFMP